MHAEDLIGDDNGEGEKVEELFGTNVSLTSFLDGLARAHTSVK